MAVDSRQLRETVGQFVTGVTVVAADVEGTLRAMTASSFTSLSLDPPLVLFCVGKDRKLGQAVRPGAPFSINILRREQQDVSNYCAGAWRESAPPTFHFEPWEGTARLSDSAATLGCVVDAIHEGGDHWIVIGLVVAAYKAEGLVSPLVCYGSRYVTLEEVVTS